MSSVQHLRQFIRERLTAFAEEILAEVEKTIVRNEEDNGPPIKPPRIEQLKHHGSIKEEVLIDPNLWNQQRNSSLDQEEPEPPQIKEEPEPSEIKQEEERPEPPHVPEPEEPSFIRGNQSEPDQLQINEELEEPEFGNIVVWYQEEARLLDLCWRTESIRTEPLKIQDCKEEEVHMDRAEPEPPQIKDEQQEPEYMQIEVGTSGSDYQQNEEAQKNPEGLDVREDPEEPEPLKTKYDPEKTEPQQFEEELENPESLDNKDDPGDPEPTKTKKEQPEPEPPQVRDKQQEPEPPQVRDKQQEPEPEPPQVRDKQQGPEPEPPQVRDKQQEPEPPQVRDKQQEPELPQIGLEELQLLTFLTQSGQQIHQLISACKTDTFMDPLTYRQNVFSPSEPVSPSEPDPEKLHLQNPPEPQHSSGEVLIPDPGQITKQPEPPSVHREQKELCRSWEEQEELWTRTSQEHDGFTAEPDTKQLHFQNLPEEQKSFIELKSFYSCVSPDPEMMHGEPEPPLIEQEHRKFCWSWEEELMIRRSQEHEWSKAEPELLHYQNSPEDSSSYFELQGFYSGSEWRNKEQYGSEPSQCWKLEHSEGFTSQERFWFIVEPNTEQLVAQTSFAAKNQNQDGTSSFDPSHTQNLMKCSVCDEVDKSSGLSQHPGVQLYVCRRCGERSVRDSRVMRHHMDAHRTEQPEAQYRDRLRGRQNFFAKLASLKSNNKRFHQKQLVCETCGKHFRSPALLKGHMTIHQENAEKPFFCQLCKKRFASHSGKKDHMERHKGKKLVSCKKCGKAFTQGKQYLNHTATRSGSLDKGGAAAHMRTAGKLHSCRTCGKCFSSGKGVKAHEKRGRYKRKVQT